MIRLRHLLKFCTLQILLLVCLVFQANAIELKQSLFDKNLNEIKYNSYALGEIDQSGFSYLEKQTEEAENWGDKSLKYKHKSPMKAFALSLAVPGLGQYYYGSKIKPLIFIGVEAASWMMHVKFDNQGKDSTEIFEQFNRDHWSRDDYSVYVNELWGTPSDEGINDLTHHIPSTNTQQFYEMTGKYSQFAWGWDDAELGENKFTLEQLIANGGLVKIDVGNQLSVPNSDKRNKYEIMRNNANDRFSQAKNMSYVTMANHLISAFEAFFTTKNHNKDLKKAKNEFTQWKVKATLKSFHTKYDTPYLHVTFKL